VTYFASAVIAFLSGEWLLENRSNGAHIIVMRSLWAAGWIYLAAIALTEISSPGSRLCFSEYALRKRVSETIPWFGAIFAGVYLALYARFAGQWQYLAQLYNQLLHTATTTSPANLNSKKWAEWRAAFVEDAFELHLACKPMFAAAVNGMLKNAEVMAAFKDNTVGADKKLASMHARFSRLGLSPFAL
jgi:hypothetical protein